MDHQVLGTREDGERTYSYQVIADGPFPCGRHGRSRAYLEEGKEGRVTLSRWYLKDLPPIVGVARARPSRGREGRDGFRESGA